MIGLTDILHNIIKVLAAIALLVMMVLTFSDVNLRYWLGEPILGSNEMTEFLLGTIVFAGLVIVSGERSHIMVTLFEPFLMKKIPYIYRMLGLFTNIAGIVAVTLLIANYTQFLHGQGNETEIREWEWWWLGTLLTVLAVIAVLMAIRSIRRPLRQMGVEDFGAIDTGDDERPEQGGRA